MTIQIRKNSSKKGLLIETYKEEHYLRAPSTYTGSRRNSKTSTWRCNGYNGRYSGTCYRSGCKNIKPGQDFFPLTVDYQEKFYAAGRIPGSFFKREGRPSEKETLTSRLIDRPIRPLFPEGFYNEVQVVATVMSSDNEVDADIPSIIGTSAALILSGIPFDGPLGAARVGYINNEYVLNPTTSELRIPN